MEKHNNTQHEKKNTQCERHIIHFQTVAEVQGGMPPEEKLTALAELFKNFGDPTRVKILKALALSEMCVCDLAALLAMTKSAVSHQLKTLRLSELVRSRKEGKVVYYSLKDAHVESILTAGFEHIDEKF